MRCAPFWLSAPVLCLLAGGVSPAAEYFTEYIGNPWPPPSPLAFDSTATWKVKNVNGAHVAAGSVPGPGDLVHITAPTSGDIVNVGTLDIQASFNFNQITADQIIVSGNSLNLGSNISTPTLKIAGGDVTLNSNFVLTSFEISNGNLLGTGVLSVTGSGSILGGILSGSGTVEFAAGSVATIDPSGTNGNLKFLETRKVKIGGTGTLKTYAGYPQNYLLGIGDGATLEIAQGGTLTTTGSAWIYATSTDTGRQVLVNGTLIANATKGFDFTGYGTDIYGTVFNVPLMIGNTGTVTINDGCNLTTTAGDCSGTLNPIGSGIFCYKSGQASLSATSAFTGTGIIRVSGGQITSAGGGTSFLGTCEVTGGEWDFNGQAQAGSFRCSGGIFGGTGTLTIVGSGSLIAGGTLNGSGALNFASGSSMAIDPSGTNGVLKFLESRSVRIIGSGTLKTYAGYPQNYLLGIGDNAVLEVAQGGTLTTIGSAWIYAASTDTGRRVLVNGTLIANASAGVNGTIFGTIFDVPTVIGTTGTVTVHDSLNLSTGTTTNAGIIEIRPGATWAFSPTNVTFTGNGQARGTGTLKPAATWALDQIRLDPGQTAAITGTLNIAGAVSGRIPALPILVNGALADRLAITGSIGATPVDLAFTVGTAPTETSYTIVSWTSGSTVPTLGTITGLPTGYAVAVDVGTKSIVLRQDLPPSTPTDIDPAPNQVAYSAPVGTPVGLTGNAVDPDGKSISYTLIDTVGGRFAINPMTGVVTVAGVLGMGGSYPVTISATDGTSSSQASFTIIVTPDAVPPTVTISGPSKNLVNVNDTTSYSLSLSDADSGLSPSTLTLDQIALLTTGTASGTLTLAGSRPQYTVTVSNCQGDGTVTIQVKAGAVSDLAGNPSAATEATVLVTVDNTRPNAPTITRGLEPSSDGKPVLGGSGDAFTTISVYEMNTLLGTCLVNANGQWDITLPVQLKGIHSYNVVAKDAAGNGAPAGLISIQVYSPVEAFIARFYQQCLIRSPDSAGLSDWTNQLVSGNRTGASLAYGFVFSQEFIGRNLTNEAFVDTLYSAFFNRAADAGGKAGWLAQLNGGALREDVLNGFLFAPEFNNLCASYGITKYSAADAQKKQIREFTRRFYQQCLSREPDAGGASDWANQLIAGTRTGATLAEGFVGSQEFIGRGLTDDQFLIIMYKAFFDREGDAGGLAGWKADLIAGKTRLQVVAGFTHAQEFINLCANYGITPFSAGG